MTKVPAPEGYEGMRWFNVDSKAWNASYRSRAELYWTTASPDIGHVGISDETLDSRASEAIQKHIQATRADR